MTERMGLTEFFAMEAGDYLERIDALIATGAAPDGHEFVRLTRALRGSALMANQSQIGAAAEALESLARAVKERRAAWDDATRQVAIRGVDGLKILVRSVASWGQAEDARAAHIAHELNVAAGTPTAAPASRREAEADSGTRAFIARESATVASSIDQVARALQRGPIHLEQYEGVLKAMQPLRGLAMLSELSPMPEILEGVERAIGVAQRGVNKPNDLALLFDVAARGLSSASRQITSSGAAQPDSHEAREFARRLAAILESGADVVPIQSLYYDDEGPTVVEEGTQPAVPGKLAQLELVAHGEHLTLAAAELERAQWDTQRELRALALSSTFRSLASASGGPLEAAVSRFADTARNAVSHGAPVHQTDAFVAQLREAGAILTSSTEGDEQELAQRLDQVTHSLGSLPAAPAAAPEEVAGGPIHRPPAPSSAGVAEAQPPEPIQKELEPAPADAASAAGPLAGTVPTAPTRERAPIEPATPPEPEPVAPVPADAEQRGGLAESWQDYEQARQLPEEPGLSIDALLAGTPVSSAGPASIPAVELPAPSDNHDAVLITDLCYSGEAALQEAQSVRDRIRSVLTQEPLDPSLVNELVEELLDLVELSHGQPA